MINRKQQLIIGGGYYIIAVLVVLFFYREKSVSSEFVQMICAVLFLWALPMLIIKKGFADKGVTAKKVKLEEYNWPERYVKKQLKWSIVFIWGCSLLFWGFMIQWGGEDTSSGMIWKNNQAIKIALINLTIVPVGLLAQEFFFRGFLLRILKNSFNKLFSVSVVAVLAGVFSMIVAQKLFDWQVILGILIANVFLGLVALKFRSIIFPFFIYWVVVVGLNFIVLYQTQRGIGN